MFGLVNVVVYFFVVLECFGVVVFLKKVRSWQRIFKRVAHSFGSSSTILGELADSLASEEAAHFDPFWQSLWRTFFKKQ